uniref:AIG1-type G domain-containing protein n=1 Tax=Mola mola TaxID=94237 RepID=A0A3Q3X2I6_MOLML
TDDINMLNYTYIRIVLLGAKGSGKTTTLNTILGRAGSQPLGRTAQCTVGRGVAFGRRLTAVDTPGWWMNYFCDENILYVSRGLRQAVVPSSDHQGATQCLPASN